MPTLQEYLWPNLFTPSVTWDTKGQHRTALFSSHCDQQAKVPTMFGKIWPCKTAHTKVCKERVDKRPAVITCCWRDDRRAKTGSLFPAKWGPVTPFNRHLRDQNGSLSHALPLHGILSCSTNAKLCIRLKRLLSGCPKLPWKCFEPFWTVFSRPSIDVHISSVNPSVSSVGPGVTLPTLWFRLFQPFPQYRHVQTTSHFWNHPNSQGYFRSHMFQAKPPINKTSPNRSSCLRHFAAFPPLGLASCNCLAKPTASARRAEASRFLSFASQLLTHMTVGTAKLLPGSNHELYLFHRQQLAISISCKKKPLISQTRQACLALSWSSMVTARMRPMPLAKMERPNCSMSALRATAAPLISEPPFKGMPMVKLMPGLMTCWNCGLAWSLLMVVPSNLNSDNQGLHVPCVSTTFAACPCSCMVSFMASEIHKWHHPNDVLLPNPTNNPRRPMDSR